MPSSQPKHTAIQTLGEFGLIDRLSAGIQLQQKTSLMGIGDDAAVIDAGEHVVVVTTDMLMEGIHFDLSYTPLKHLGFKAVAVNVSDVAAMNAVPEQITVSIALSNRFSVEAVDELYAGIKVACESYKIDLVGGDTTSSRSGLGISITALGRARKEALSYRSGAKKGDIVCVTGDLGAAYMGLQVLEREKQEFMANPNMQPGLQDYEYVVGRQLKPEARTDIIHTFKELGVVPSAMIDISDGLASEILHIAKASGLGALLYENKLPFDKRTVDLVSNEFKIPLGTCGLNGGEDYELLFTINQKDYEQVKNIPDVSFIGFMQDREEGVKFMTNAEQLVDIQAQGWSHFKEGGGD